MGKIKLNDIFDIADLQSTPEHFDKLELSEEIIQTLAWLVGYDGKGRRLIRADELGGLLTSPIYTRFPKSIVVPVTSVQNTWTSVVGIPANKMALVMSTSCSGHFRIYETVGGDYNEFVISYRRNFIIPHKVGAITVNTFPNATGTAGTFGITFFDD